jgi:hypothetical protein
VPANDGAIWLSIVPSEEECDATMPNSRNKGWLIKKNATVLLTEKLFEKAFDK